MNNEQIYRQCIEDLHSIDLGKYIELPQLAVMGDTSSGKSSLLSAISEIQLPANDQITTRCPTRIRMEKNTSNNEVRARVDVKWHTDSPYKDEGTSTWERKETTDFSQLAELISMAQKHILDLAKKGVAHDIIEVWLYSPNMNDLTLIDLPGSVRSVGRDEDASLIEDIHNLNRTFLINERCVILAIIPANVDFHNCAILSDALEVDPNTRRTLPVITKPDLIDPGAEGAVLDLLQGSYRFIYSIKFKQFIFYFTRQKNQRKLFLWFAYVQM
jgi:hypothetical protein